MESGKVQKEGEKMDAIKEGEEDDEEEEDEGKTKGKLNETMTFGF